MSREHDPEVEGDASLERRCSRAVEEAATRLRIPPERLVGGLVDGRLADLVLELANLRHRALAADRQRIDELLVALGADPGRF